MATNKLDQIRAELEEAALRYAMGGGIEALDQASQKILAYHKRAAENPEPEGELIELSSERPTEEVQPRLPRMTRATSAA